jgi:ribosomal protein L37AE/L43A
MISATQAGAGRDNRRVTLPDGDDDALAVHPCRSLCRWVGTRRAPHELFACQGCGSQWRPGESWTPVDADGRVPRAVRQARRRFTSAPHEGAAGHADSRTTSGS